MKWLHPFQIKLALKFLYDLWPWCHVVSFYSYFVSQSLEGNIFPGMELSHLWVVSSFLAGFNWVFIILMYQRLLLSAGAFTRSHPWPHLFTHIFHTTIFHLCSGMNRRPDYRLDRNACEWELTMFIKVRSKKEKDQTHVGPEPFKAHLCNIKPEQDHVLCVCYKTRGTFPLAVQRICFEGGPGSSRTIWHGRLGSEREVSLV